MSNYYLLVFIEPNQITSRQYFADLFSIVKYLKIWEIHYAQIIEFQQIYDLREHIDAILEHSCGVMIKNE